MGSSSPNRSIAQTSPNGKHGTNGARAAAGTTSESAPQHHLQITRLLVAAALAGTLTPEQSSVPASDYGEYHELASAVLEAYAEDGPAGAKRAIEAALHVRLDWQTVVEGHPWATQVRTLKHAFQPREPRLQVVQGLITIPSLSMICGAPGVGKTFLAMSLELAVVSGKPWPLTPGETPISPRDTQTVNVIHVDRDSGQGLLDERFRALALGMGISPDIDLPLNG